MARIPQTLLETIQQYERDAFNEKYSSNISEITHRVLEALSPEEFKAKLGEFKDAYDQRTIPEHIVYGGGSIPLPSEPTRESLALAAYKVPNETPEHIVYAFFSKEGTPFDAMNDTKEELAREFPYLKDRLHTFSPDKHQI